MHNKVKKSSSELFKIRNILFYSKIFPDFTMHFHN